MTQISSKTKGQASLRILVWVSMGFLIATVIVVFLAKNEGFSSDKSQVAVSSAAAKPVIDDASLIQEIGSQIAETEQLFFSQEDKFLLARQEASKNHKLSDFYASKSTSDSLFEMSMTIDRAGDMDLPDINNLDAKSYTDKAIEAHKKWAIAQQEKLKALVNSDFELVRKMQSQSDSLAAQSASALNSARKSAGLLLP